MYFGNLVYASNFIKRTHNTFHADDVENCLHILGNANQRRIDRKEKSMEFVSSLYIEEAKELIYTTIKMTKLNDGRWQYVEMVDDVVENYVPFFLKTC